MSIEVKVPDLGDGIEGGDVLKVLVSEGDTIVAEQGVVELETDKAVAEIPSPRGGRVQKIHVKAGETVAVGSTLITLEESAAEAKPETKPAAKPAPAAAAPPAPKPAPPAPVKASAAPAEKPAAPAPREPAKPAAKAPAAAPPNPAAPVAATDNDLTPAAGPAMRRLARELGVDLGTVEGSGPSGRILKDDILSSVRAANRAAAANRNQPAPSAAPADRTAAPGAAEATILAGEPGEDKWGPVRRDRLTRIRATIAERMQQSSATIPHVTNFDDADITELEKLRQASKRDYAASGVRLTTLPFVLKAVALSLKHHPALNASLDLEAGEVIYKQYVNLGVAVDTDRGLIVPNLRNADQLPIPQLAQALEDLGRRARGGQFTIDDLRGGTFSISNLGAIGGTYSTPIINAPEVAILLLGRARQMPVVVSDKVEIRLMLPLSLSYDHRLVDGAVAARFLNEVKGLLEAPGRLLLAP